MESGAGRQKRKPGSKSGVIYRQTVPEPSPSSLATFSFFAGVFSFLGLFGVGGIAAIAAGTLALRRIKASNGRLYGRKFARIGRILGFINLATLPLFVAAYFAWRSAPSIEATAYAPARARSSTGVKRKDQLDPRELDLIRKIFKDLDPTRDGVQEERIVAAYFGPQKYLDPEIALLTTKRIEHFEGSGSISAFLLANVRDDIEIDEDRGETGSAPKRYRLRIINSKDKRAIVIPFYPPEQGPDFYADLRKAMNAAKALP